MPDAKYGSDEPVIKYSHSKNYVAIMKATVREMHRQMGDLVLDEVG